VIFHDLEVEDDPSYFVGGVAVHNCHKLTKDAQEAFLKGLEDPPAHAYYVLCTTEPEKLLPTLRGRCSAFLVHLLTEPEMLKLLGRIAAREGAQIPRSSIQKIVEVSGGHCRDAIQMLQQMIADPDATLASFQSSEAKTIDLCRALIGAKGWKEVASILAELKDEDVERTRRAVLGYCTVILLKGANERAMVVLDQFVSNFYDSGFPGLVHASYCVVNGDNGGA
jgi:DNA polymerase III gamma/tau subunit